MKQNIWIWNHYATSMYKDHAGRHYYFAKNLIDKGFKVTIFCANTYHNASEVIDTGGKKYTVDKVSQIPFVFVKTAPAKNNGLGRLRNMGLFYFNMLSVAKSYAKLNGKPDVIIASSVHPLTLVAGIKTARNLKIPCICEVRDLWPESIVAYGILKKKSILARILYCGEKWIYRKADFIIMTWEGGKDYIVDQGWTKQVSLKKIKHISNGVQISSFDKESEGNRIKDADLDNRKYKNIIYTGSIRKVNNLGMLLDTAKVIKHRGRDDIRFLIFGVGNELEFLRQRCREEHIDNLIFKGYVKKKYVPYILKKAYINILHNSSTSLDKYGQSQNKLFEYMAAGRCVIQTYTTRYSIIKKANCGIMVSVQNPDEIAEAVITACNDDAGCQTMGANARAYSAQFDYTVLTGKLIEVINTVLKSE